LQRAFSAAAGSFFERACGLIVGDVLGYAISDVPRAGVNGPRLKTRAEANAAAGTVKCRGVIG
jgi:hypothetical protein